MGGRWRPGAHPAARPARRDLGGPEAAELPAVGLWLRPEHARPHAARYPPAVGGARSPCRRRHHRWLRRWGLWRLRGHRFISALGAAEIPHISCEVSEDRMIRKDKVLRNVAVGNDQSIHADRLEQPLRSGPSGDPANEHDVPVGRVLDGLGAEVGNEVEQIDDALGRATSEAYPPLLSQYQKRLDAR